VSQGSQVPISRSRVSGFMYSQAGIPAQTGQGRQSIEPAPIAQYIGRR
jgi:hypothetical protein